MAMSDSQWYPSNFDPIREMENTIVFLTCKLFDSDNFYIAFYIQEMRMFFFCREDPENKNRVLRNKNMDI